MLEGELEKLLHIEDRLRQRVVGQDEALLLVANAVRRSRAGLGDPRGPSAPSSSWAPPAWARPSWPAPWPSSSSTTRRPWSASTCRSTWRSTPVSRLIGAPPGYIGYDEGGQLTEAIRRRPYAVVLFDEIEKAHPDVFNVLLQVLEDGRLTDGKGRTVDFRNTVLIMTSNVASDLIQEMARHESKDMKDRLMDALRKTFRPEFLNRIDEIVTFKSLGPDEIYSIVDIQLRDLKKRLAERKITLDLTEEARKSLAERGYDPGLRRPPAEARDPAHGREPARGRGPGRQVQGRRPRRGGHQGPRDLLLPQGRARRSTGVGASAASDPHQLGVSTFSRKTMSAGTTAPARSMASLRSWEPTKRRALSSESHSMRMSTSAGSSWLRKSWPPCEPVTFRAIACSTNANFHCR
jgi:hypothetical protein